MKLCNKQGVGVCLSCDGKPDDKDTICRHAIEKMKIYTIWSGEYSDTRTEGYCTSEEKAKIICGLKYSEQKGKKWRRNYYYKEEECLDNTITSDKVIGIEYSLFASKKDGNNEYEISFYDSCFSTIENNWVEHNMMWKDDTYKIYIYSDHKLETNKVEKIAQDFFYQYLAEKEGLL